MEQRDPLALEKEKILESGAKKGVGYRLIGLLTVLVFISLVGAYRFTTAEKNKSREGSEANCEQLGVLRDLTIDLLRP